MSYITCTANQSWSNFYISDQIGQHSSHVYQIKFNRYSKSIDNYSVKYSRKPFVYIHPDNESMFTEKLMGKSRLI